MTCIEHKWSFPYPMNELYGLRWFHMCSNCGETGPCPFDDVPHGLREEEEKKYRKQNHIETPTN